MKKLISALFMSFLIIPYTGASVEEGFFGKTINEISTIQDFNEIPHSTDGYFIENRGQAEDDVLFIYNGYPKLLVHNDGITVIMASLSYKITIEGGSRQVTSSGFEDGPLFNFYYGNDPDSWVSGARSFRSVIVENIKQGMDLKVKTTDQGPKWDLILEEARLVDDLSVTYGGDVEIKRVDDRHLSIENDITSLMEGPYIFFQNEREVPGQFKLNGNSLKFLMDDIDPFTPLVIDPLLVASTFIGGNSWDQYPDVTIHPSGDILITAITESSNMHTHLTAYDRSLNGNMDILVCRMSSDLSSLKFATYLGGTGYDRALDTECDFSGSLQVVGSTSSTDFPTTTQAIQPLYQGGDSDGFYLRLSADLGTLFHSTYMGGSRSDNLTGVEIGPENEIFICGSTSSNDLPSTTGAYQEFLKGNSDGFVAKFSTDLTTLEFLSYIGGDGFGDDVNDLAVDDMGRPIVVGYAASDDFPTTQGAFRNGSGYYQGFVTRFTSDGSALNMSTYLGYGTVIESIFLSDHIYLTGTTVSISGVFPVSDDAFDKDLTGKVDGFITKMALNGSVILNSTYIGHNEKWGNPPEGDYIEGCTKIIVDQHGRPVVTGYTDSTFFPLSADAFDTKREMLESFVLMMDRNLTRIEYSTFLGGYEEERGTGLALDGSGWLFAVGHTYDDQGKADFPTTEGAYDITFNSQYDLYAVRFKLDSFLPGPPTDLSSTFFRTSINLTWKPPTDDGNEPVEFYNIYRGMNPSSLSIMGTTGEIWFNDTGLDKGITYYYEVKAVNIVGEGTGTMTFNTPYTIPGPVQIVDISPGNSHINISWNPPADNGGTSNITYTVAFGTDMDLLENIREGIRRRWFDITELTNGIKYFFNVFAENHMGTGPGSDIKNSTPLGRPTPPTNLSATPGDGSVTLAWNEPLDKGGSSAVFYNVYRYVNGSYYWAIKNGLFENSYRITGMINGHNYTYYVTASNLLGEGLSSEMVTVTPFGMISEPFNLTGTEHGNRVSLRWSRSNITGNSWKVEYDIHMGRGPGNLSIVGSTYSTNISIFNLTPGNEYYFHVTARNPVFTSDPSNIIMLRPLEVPSEPTGLEFITGDQFIDLSWTAPEYLGGSISINYTVYLGGSVANIINWKTTTNTMVNLTELENGRRYFISVRAVNEKGPGPFSRVINATPMTVPTVPRYLTYSEGDRSIDLSWDTPFGLGGATNVTYNVYMGSNRSDIILFEGGLKEKRLIIEDLENGMEYTIGVTAENIIGESPIAILERVVPMTEPGPPSISGINISKEPPGLIISWKPPENDGGSQVWYYFIYREEENDELTEIGNVGGHARSYTDTDMIRGNRYTYYIRAETSYGVSPLSEPFVVEYPNEESEKLTTDLLMYIIAGGLGILILIITIIAASARLKKNARDRRMWEE